jgi:hypothetical protein
LIFRLSSNFSSEPTRVDDLRQQYPDFDTIYRHHVDEAKFDVVDDTKFRSLKEQLNAKGVQPVLSKSDKKKERGKRFSFSKRFSNSLRSTNTGEETSQKEVTKLPSDISDSDFLLDLKGIQDVDLAAPIHEAMLLAQSYLSSLIDSTVGTMTYDVLKMQQEEHKRRVRRQIEAEEKEALDSILIDFIRKVNIKSTARKTS